MNISAWRKAIQHSHLISDVKLVLYDFAIVFEAGQSIPPDTLAPRAITIGLEESQIRACIYMATEAELLTCNSFKGYLPKLPKSKPEILVNAFEEQFWPYYPRQRRGNRSKAYKAYLRALDRSTEQEILTGLMAYLQSDEVKRGFAKGAEAWLNDDRWTVNYTNRRPHEIRDQLSTYADRLSGTQPRGKNPASHDAGGGFLSTAPR